ncbi:hypothetical protein I4U23_010434 [Adineta vaga]|nr:hypothetical protein I4U23_010434 [Adineta vaga]
MSTNKRKKIVRAIDHHEFESFVRTHLAADIADIIILTIGIRSFGMFLQINDFDAEILNVYDMVNEKDKLNLFLHSNTSSTMRVKPAIIRELNFFQNECIKQINNGRNNSDNSSSTQCENEPKRFRKSSNTLSTIIRDRSNDIEESFKMKYREKPVNKKSETTDWSFNIEEASDYDVQSKGLTIRSSFIVEEVTHTYVTTQKINHFFKKNMQINSEDIQKFVFLIQHSLCWHSENLYEFTMKARTNSVLYGQFIEEFQSYCSTRNTSLIEKSQWLVKYIRKTKYKPSGYGYIQ